MNNKIKNAQKIFEKYNSVKLAYLFGSRATGEVGPNSDYDFAVFLDPRKKKTFFDTKLELLGNLVGALRTDKVDLVVLNNSERPELNYEVITNGKLIKEVEPAKLIVEPKIMNDYFDFIDSLRKHNLTRA